MTRSKSIYYRKTLSPSIMNREFNLSSSPLYYIGRIKEDEKNYLVYETNKPMSIQNKIKEFYPEVETRWYYPHKLYVRAR